MVLVLVASGCVGWEGKVWWAELTVRIDHVQVCEEQNAGLDSASHRLP